MLMIAGRVFDNGPLAGRVVGRVAWWRTLLVCIGPVLLAAGQARAALPSNCAQNGQEVTCSFSFTGNPDQTFTVPAGISNVKVLAVGAAGGAAGPRFPTPAPGGAGAVATGMVNVTAGQTLYVEVGGRGGDGFDGSAPGFNGAVLVTTSRAPGVAVVGARRMCAALRMWPV